MSTTASVRRALLRMHVAPADIPRVHRSRRRTAWALGTRWRRLGAAFVTITVMGTLMPATALAVGHNPRVLNHHGHRAPQKRREPVQRVAFPSHQAGSTTTDAPPGPSLPAHKTVMPATALRGETQVDAATLPPPGQSTPAIPRARRLSGRANFARANELSLSAVPMAVSPMTANIVPSITSMLPFSGTTVWTQKPTFTVNYSDPDGPSDKCSVAVYNSAGTLVAGSASFTITGSSGVCTWTDTVALAWGSEFHWTAQVNDTLASSPLSAASYFVPAVIQPATTDRFG